MKIRDFFERKYAGELVVNVDHPEESRYRFIFNNPLSTMEDKKKIVIKIVKTNSNSDSR